MIAAYDDYFNGYEPISERLAKALNLALRGGASQRFIIADNVAEALGLDLDPESITPHGYSVLLSLLPGLEEVLEEEGSLSDAPARIAQAVTDGMDLPECLD